jgi:stress response protein SCP2
MTQMTMGGNIALATNAVRAVLQWSGGPDVPDVDASALLLDDTGEVASDGDFVFYNQPEHYSGSVRLAARAAGSFVDVIDVNLAAVPAAVQRIVLAASADGGTFGQVPGLLLQIVDGVSGAQIAYFPMNATEETAYVSGELYRRDGGWKFRAVGQGYASGLAGLAADFGIDVGEPDEDVAAAAPPEAAAQPGVPALPPLPPLPAPPAAPAAPAAPPVPEAEPAPAVAAPAPLDLTPAAPASLDLTPAAPAPLDLTPAAPAPLDLTPPAPGSPPVAPPPPVPPAPPVPVLPPQPLVPPVAVPDELVPPVTVPAELVPPASAAPVAMPAPPPVVTAPPVPAPVISLRRNELVDLARTSSDPLGRLVFTLGWTPAHGRGDTDLDASVIAFDASGKKLAIVWYMHLSEFYGALQHTGDNRGEHGQPGLEQVLVDLTRLPVNVHALVFTINSFRGQTFTDIAQAYCVVQNYDTGAELARYELTDTQPSTALLISVLRRTPTGSWDLRAIGEFHDFRTVKKLVPAAARQVQRG